MSHPLGGKRRERMRVRQVLGRRLMGGLSAGVRLLGGTSLCSLCLGREKVTLFTGPGGLATCYHRAVSADD